MQLADVTVQGSKFERFEFKIGTFLVQKPFKTGNFILQMPRTKTLKAPRLDDEDLLEIESNMTAAAMLPPEPKRARRETAQDSSKLGKDI